MTTEPVTPEMLEVPEKIAHFMATLDESLIEDIFSEDDVTIIENFLPHVFAGEDAQERWTEAFRDHAAPLTDLLHRFAAPQDCSVHGNTAFFTLPTVWSGKNRGKPFCERGGWAFVLVRQSEMWRVKAYAWAVTETDRG
jgi:hypothetical protein